MTWFTAQERHPCQNPLNIKRLFVCSLKRYSAGKFLEILREIVFPNYLTYTCVNDAYSDFIYRFVEAINFIALSKKIRVKTNSKPWFDNQIVPAIQRRDKLYKKFKHSGLGTDTDNFKVAKMHLQKMILKKKKSYFERTLEGFKATRSKSGQSKSMKNFSEEMWCYSCWSTGKRKYFQNVVLWISRRPPRKTAKSTQQIYSSNNQKLLRQDFMRRIQWLSIFKRIWRSIKKILLNLDTSKAAGMD